MEFDSDEENRRIASWISIKSLKEAVDIHSVYKLESESSSPNNESPDSSITMEWKPNTHINHSISFSSVHDPYCEDSLNTFEDDSARDLESMKYCLQRRDAKLRKLHKKYKREITKLQEENERLKLDLEHAQEEAKHFSEEVERLHQDHTVQLQSLQARHERKLQRSKQDLESLITNLNSKAAEDLREQLEQERQDQISDLQLKHELELQEKTEDYENLIQDLKGQVTEYQEYVQTLENSCKSQIEAVKRKYTKEVSALKEKSSKGLKKSPLKIYEDPSKDREIETLQHRIKELETSNSEQNRIIESQEKTIEELSRELQGAFKKKPSKQGKLENSGFEKDIQGVISQIK